MGYLANIDDPELFLTLSLVAQVFGGIGAGANQTASLAILSSFESTEREQYIGWIEAANGVGLLFGPLLGAVLYGLGGFQAPFFTFATLYVASYPFIYFNLSRSQQYFDQIAQDQTV